MPPLSWVSTAVILSSITTTLLLLRNNQNFLHQSLNFVLSLSNYPRSGTMLFGVVVCTFLLYTAGAGTIDISSISDVAGSVLLFDTLSSLIVSDPNISSNTSIAFRLCSAILSVHSLYHNCFILFDRWFCLVLSVDFFFTIPLLQSELLWLMPPGCSMKKGKEYDNTIGCAVVVSVSTSCNRCYNFALSSQSPHVVLLIYLMYCTLFSRFLLVYIA